MRCPRTPGRPIQLSGWVRVDITRLGALRGVQCHIGGVVAFAGFLPFCFSGLRVSPVVMSSLNLFISPQLPSKNAADPTHARTLRHPTGLQEYALRPAGVLPKKRAFPCTLRRCWLLVLVAKPELPCNYPGNCNYPQLPGNYPAQIPLLGNSPAIRLGGFSGGVRSLSCSCPLVL